MIRTFSAYLDFCYLARRPVIDEDSLTAIQDSLARFYQYRVIFQTTGVREPGPKGFSLPRQHSIKHYPELIIAFGAPNGLCSSMTENKHINAVKKPWRRSGRHEALGQMLLTNQRLDKLAAARRDFHHRGMLKNDYLSEARRMVMRQLEGDSSGEDSEREEDDLDPSPRGMNEEVNGESDEEDDWAPVEGPTVLNHVTLARSKGFYSSF